MERPLTLVVASPEPRSPAFQALEMEGLEPTEAVCQGPHDYGRVFTELWNAGDPFVLCEHDVIPWPGSVSALLSCPESWCTHRYPLHLGNLTTSFGIGKYRPDGPAPEEWAHCEWRLLDGFVIPLLRQRLRSRPCVHEPPVAHARQEIH